MNNTNLNEKKSKTGLVAALLVLVVLSFVVGWIPMLYIPIGIAISIISIIVLIKETGFVKKAAIALLITTVIGMGINTASLISKSSVFRQLPQQIEFIEKNNCLKPTDFSTESTNQCIIYETEEYNKLSKNSPADALVAVAMVYSLAWFIINLITLINSLSEIKARDTMQQMSAFAQATNMNSQTQFSQAANVNSQAPVGQETVKSEKN